MKALILAAGKGNRLLKKTHYTNKCLLKINGKHLLEYSLDAASKIADEIVIVVGYKSKDIKNQFGSEYKEKKISYVVQEEQIGMVDAIACSRKQIGNNDFMLFLGDEILINPRHEEMQKKIIEEKLFCVCGVVKEKNTNLISKTYTLSIGIDGAIDRLIEKPVDPYNDLMGTGNCVLSKKFFEFIERTPTSKYGDRRLFPDVIQTAIDSGEKAKCLIVCDKYVNVNDSSDFLRAEKLFF